MKLHQANVVGLTSPLQRAEMKSILDGAWPPLKPLPVFRFEDEDHRATIDFDKLRGEWVCRLTAFPSNTVRELRGGLREILLALPNGQAELSAESTEQIERELERDASRRKQALLEWKENYESGALYFALGACLSESQRSEVDDSLRLSLTARQLQYSAKNVAYVFDALSGAGGRPATLIQLARRKKAELETLEGVASPEEESRDSQCEQGLQICWAKVEPTLVDLSICEEECAEPCDDLENFPAVSVASIPPEHEKPPSHEIVALVSEIQAHEIAHETSLLRIDGLQEGLTGPSTLIDLGGHLRTGKGVKSGDHEECSHSRFPVLEISGFQIAAIALVFLLAVAGVTVGLTALHGQLGKYFGKTSNPTLDVKTVPPAVPDRPDETDPLNSGSPATGVPEKKELRSENPTSVLPTVERPESATGPATVQTVPSPSAKERSGLIPFEIISKESDHDPEPAPELLSRDSLAPPATSSKPVANSESTVGSNGSARVNKPSVQSAVRTPTNSAKAIALINGSTQNAVPRKFGKTPHTSRASTILVTAPAHGSKPYRVIFPEKAIAASSSFAMSSQLSILVSPETGAVAAHKPARLQAGELVSYVWPHFPRPKDNYGASETVKVRTTVGPLGQVLDVKLLDGSSSFLPATIRAIRQWRYTPTRLNERPVQVQQDVTIEFRPSEYSSEVSAHHSSQN